VLNFLNSSILFLAAAASLPFLIHLFTRSKSKIISFSTLQFLKELQHQKIRRVKIRQILLLILRTLIILLLVLAFARPVIRPGSSSAVESNAKTTAAIVLDNSFSMRSPHNGTTLFDVARRSAKRILQTLRPGDEVFLVTTTDTLLQISKRPFHDFDIFQKEIDRTKIDFRPTNLSAALSLANRLLLSSKNINKEVYILSDLQKTAFPSDSLDIVNGNIHYYLMPIRSKSVMNLTIESSELKTTLLERGKVAEIQTVISNKGTKPARSRLAQLFLNGKRVAQTTVNLDPGASKTESFKFILDNTGFVSGSIALEDDDIPEDNRYYFSFHVPEKIRVALVGSSSYDTYYLFHALNPGGSSHRTFATERVALQDFPYLDLQKYDVIALCNLPSIKPGTVEKLRNFVQSGGGLLMALGSNIDIKSYNGVVVPALRLPPFLSVIGSLDETDQHFSIGKTDLQHPVFSGIFKERNPNFSKPNFKFAIKVAHTENMQSIMDYSSGDPFLFETKIGQGSILVFTTGFDLEVTDFVHRTIFAPLLTRAIFYLQSHGPGAYKSYRIGEAFRYRLPAEAIHTNLSMERPDDKSDHIQPRITNSGAFIEYGDTFVPGFYKLLANGNVLNQWAVNFDARESDLSPYPEDKLVEDAGMTLIKDDERLATIVSGNRFGKELWSYFAIAAFILLIVEMLIYREKGEVTVQEAN